jgi:hypothetical protein
MKERSGTNNLVGIDYSFLASFIVSPFSTLRNNQVFLTKIEKFDSYV